MTDSNKQPVNPAEAPLQQPSAPAETSKPVSPEVQAVFGDPQKQRLDLAKELGLPPSPAAQPTGTATASGEKPAASAELTDGVKPESEAKTPDSGATGKGQASKTSVDTRNTNKDFVDFVDKSRKEAESASLGELFGKLMQSVSGLSGFIKGFADKLSGSAAKAIDTVTPAEKFSKEDLDKIKVDLEKDKDKSYPKDRSVEYVTAVLNLPVRETPQKLLEAFGKSGLFFNTKLEELKEVMPGDVIFSRKKNEKGEPYANLCAVVSTVNPLQIKLAPEGGGPPRVMSMEDFKKNYDFYGFVKLPRKETQTAQQTAPVPSGSPPQSGESLPPQPSTPS